MLRTWFWYIGVLWYFNCCLQGQLCGYRLWFWLNGKMIGCAKLWGSLKSIWILRNLTLFTCACATNSSTMWHTSFRKTSTVTLDYVTIDPNFMLGIAMETIWFAYILFSIGQLLVALQTRPSKSGRLSHYRSGSNCFCVFVYLFFL